MPFSSSWFSPKELFISWIERCIPRKWKQDVKQIGIQQYQLLKSDASTSASRKIDTNDKLMVYPLLSSLKEFIGHGDIKNAFRAFSSIQLHVASSSCYDLIVDPISSLLGACSNLKLLPQGGQLHAQIINLGFGQHCFLLSKLVNLYSNFNLLPQAHFLVKNSSLLHPLVWNILISAYTRNGLFKEALSIYKEMLNFGVRPDEFTYPSVLKACGEQADLAFGREIHKSILAGSCGMSLCVQNALISMYGKCGEIDVARELFNKLCNRDAFSWNSMISGYASKGIWEEAFELFEQMQLEGVEMNIITWNTIISGCLQTRKYQAVLGLLSRMRACAMNLDAVSIVGGLGACSHIGALELGKEIHAASVRGVYDKFQNVRNALITMYARCQDDKHAYIVFRKMEEKDIISWNSIISGYAHSNKSDEASFLFREMLVLGFEPNYVTIASILPLCARIANLHHGKELHCHIIKHPEFSDSLLLSNALIDLYARAGRILEARRVFDSLTEKDVSTYTSLISGYGVLGEGKAALKLFEEMKNSGIKPDHITMVAVLAACSHSGLLIEGELQFYQMSGVYGIRPCLEHYACMVDLYGRAGWLKKAEEIIKKMPCQPSPDMWATLLGACHIHRNTKLGELAAENLLAMRPKNAGYYVLIANMYAAAGCWTKLATVRTFMRNFGVMKPPGCAWIDVGSGFEPFLVGDAPMELSNEIYSLLEGLTKQMKDVGDGAVLDCENFQV